MKLTLKQIVNAQSALSSLGNVKLKCENAGKITYAIAKNIGLTEKFVISYQKGVQAIQEKYRVPVPVKLDEEEKFRIPDNVSKKFQEELEDLQNQEEDVDIRPIHLPAPTTENPLPITAIDRYLLDFCLTVDGEE